MKVEVDLFPDDLRRRFVPLGASTMAVLVALVVLAGGAYRFVLEQQADGVAARVARHEARVERAREAVTALESRLSEREDVADLKTRVRDKQRAVRLRRELLEQLDAGARMSRFDPVPYLEGVARRINDAVWLAKLRVASNPELIELRGHALVPEAVPQLIADLGAEPAFGRRAFYRLNMQRNEDHPGWIDFHVSTQPEAADGDG